MIERITGKLTIYFWGVLGWIMIAASLVRNHIFDDHLNALLYLLLGLWFLTISSIIAAIRNLKDAT